MGATLQAGPIFAVDDRASLRFPRITGILTASQKQELFAIYRCMEQHFGRPELGFLSAPAFEEILDLKTSQIPSYLGEYRTLLGELAQLRLDLGEKAPERLLTTRTSSRHVLLEFAQLYLVYGGFRLLGYRNYKGHMGGPFAAPNPLPYRGLEG